MEEKLALNFVFHKWAFGCCRSQTFGLVIRCVLGVKLQTFAFEVSQLHSIKLLLWNLLSQKPLSWLYLITLACMPAFLSLQNLWSFAAGSCFCTKSWSASVLQLRGVLLWTVPCVSPCGYRASDGVYSAPAFTCTTGDTRNWGGDAMNSFDGSCSGLSRRSNPSASSGYCPPQSSSEPKQQWLQSVGLRHHRTIGTCRGLRRPQSPRVSRAGSALGSGLYPTGAGDSPSREMTPSLCALLSTWGKSFPLSPQPLWPCSLPAQGPWPSPQAKNKGGEKDTPPGDPAGPYGAPTSRQMPPSSHHLRAWPPNYWDTHCRPHHLACAWGHCGSAEALLKWTWHPIFHLPVNPVTF